MLDDNYNVKVIDFGDARHVNEPLDEEEDAFGGGQRRDTFVGTVNYMSPEVINDEPQTLACDTWAMGNILFRTLCGVVPFPGTNPAKVYDDIKNRRITWPADVDQIMSKEAIHLINAMIQISPKNRLGHDMNTL